MDKSRALYDVDDENQFKGRKNRIFFTFKDIGQVIQNLIDNFFTHHFNKNPFCAITPNQTEAILRDTVCLLI